jgi:hypothetical protein
MNGLNTRPLRNDQQELYNRVNTKDPRFYELSKLLFANGMVYYHQDLNKEFNISPMIVHMNYFVGVEDKKNAFIAKNLWYIGAID